MLFSFAVIFKPAQMARRGAIACHVYLFLQALSLRAFSAIVRYMPIGLAACNTNTVTA